LLTAVVLVAALLHAIWNAILKPVDDRLQVLALGFLVLAIGCLVAAPFAVPARAAWPYLAGSSVLHMAYNILLSRSYREGDFNQVYPLARGTSPLVVALAAAVVAGERLSPAKLAGVVAISGGLAALAGRPRPGQGLAVRLAIATGLLISAYTVLDGLGVRHAGGAVSYTVWLFAAEGVLMAPFVVGQAGLVRARWRRGCLTAALAGLAYGLVIWAQRRGALAEVAALRETSVVAAAVIGAAVFHERLGARRVIMAGVVAAGIAALNLG
jgi:drug/metabolite transporter (DMT)-like permease